MRLSEWMAAAPHKDAAAAKVLAVLEPMVAMLGGGTDPTCWVLWGDDPGARYSVFVATDAGLVQIAVRVNVPGEGPRAGGKLARWNRVQLGEVGVEMQGGHRIMNVPLEGQILRGTDEAADEVAAFVLDVLAAIDGRPRLEAGAAGKASSKPAGTAGSGPSSGAGSPTAKTKPMPLLEAPGESSS